KKYSHLAHAPLFVPSVGHYAQGMLITVPITRDIVARKVTARDVHGGLLSTIEVDMPSRRSIRQTSPTPHPASPSRRGEEHERAWRPAVRQES
ncbi:MAG TPA: hypothetical protein VF915_19690, partial [Reyranella sp.]